jgi:ferrous iron transport protein B
VNSIGPEDILRARDESIQHLMRSYGDEAETLIADARYGFVSGLMRDVVRKPPIDRRTVTEWIDAVVINRWLGIPIFLGLLYGLFQFTFLLSPPLIDWIDRGFGWLGSQVSGISPAWLSSFLADGVIGGVGAVLTFVPPIFLLFMALTVLEDTGYMARAAFVMDKLMHKIGLHGRSFVPMILGFGCSVPAVMATRTIENPKDRLATILVTPFISCAARLTIYVLFVAAFFTAYQGLVIFSMYVIGVFLAIAAAWALRKFVVKGPSGHFVMELPPYRLPTIKGVAIHTWERGREFLTRAGTIIFAIVVVIWLLDYTGALEPIGRAVAPLFSPAGFGQWQAAVGLIFGFMAKEAVVGAFGTLFAGSQEGAGLGSIIGAQLGWTSLVAYSFMLFTLIYIPCMATLATIRKETNSWKWPLFSASSSVVLAWVIATVVFQIGSLFTGG